MVTQLVSEVVYDCLTRWCHFLDHLMLTEELYACVPKTNLQCLHFMFVNLVDKSRIIVKECTICSVVGA